MANILVVEVEMGKSSEIGVHEVEAKSVSNHDMPEISDAQQYLCDNVVISIEKMFNQLHSINGDCSIYQVPKQLREMNPKAYTPDLISIGPFHRKQDFKATERYKLQALVNFLRRINNNNDNIMEEEDVVKKIRSLEDLLKTGMLNVLVEKVHCLMKEARNCYSEPIDYMTDHNFVIMMLMDACFIVEFFIQLYAVYHPDDRKFHQIQDNVDHLLQDPARTLMAHDLIKLENQVPFFILQHMFRMIPQHSPPLCFTHLTYNALVHEFISTYKICPVNIVIVPNDPKHFVDFLSFYFTPSSTTNDQNKQDVIKNSENKKKNNYNFLSCFFSKLLCCQLWQNPDKENSDRETLCPPSITELCESGVTIKKAKNAPYLMNITFKNGVLKIPPLHIYDYFELMFRNVIAFEQCKTRNKNMYATQYILFMDDLISTEKDVRLLVNAGVITNNIGGSDKEVSKLFNNLGKFVNAYPSFTQFNHISKALRNHCDGR